MAESTLGLQKKDLEAEVGNFLGYGRGDDPAYGESAWTTAQRNNVVACVRAGLRQFYFPPVSQTSGVAYSWTFLSPTADVQVSSGASEAALPDDFSGFDGPLSFVDTSARWGVLEITGIGQIHSLRQASPAESGTPRVAAVEPLKGTTALAGQRFRLAVFPAADQDYTLRGRYAVIPDALTGAAPWCYGGSEHAGTILESCLAEAELRLDDTAGVHAMKFAQQLQTSISLDRKKRPQAMGYNGDRSDYRRMCERAGFYLCPVTYNGVQY